MGSLETSIVVTGAGRTKKEAFTNAIARIQPELSKTVDGYIIRIEPLEVGFIEGRQVIKIEKFLYLFMPREVSRFELRLEVRVRYFVVDAESFPYERLYVSGNLLDM